MIPLSTTAPIRHSPSWLSGLNAPAYLIRAGSVIDRATLEAELAGEHRAGRVFAFQLHDAFVAGVEALMGDDPAHVELLQLEAQERDPEEPALSSDDGRRLAAVRDALAEHYPPYCDLVSRIARRLELAPLLAFRRFCVGWENVSATFARGPDGRVTEAAMKHLDPLQLLAAGKTAYDLLYPDAEELEGNSERPSPSDATPSSSTSAATKPAGKSTKRSGRRIPSS